MTSKILLLLTFLSYGTTIWYQKYQIQLIETPTQLLPPPDIKNFTFGYNDLLSASLWIRALQNIDTCELGRYEGADYVEPTRDKDNKVTIKGVVERKIKQSKCHLGWVYQMMNLISDIYPRFKLVYDVGALQLSITVDDREGARRIFEKGIAIYPNDWRLNFAAGYHYLWEMQNVPRATELFQGAYTAGGPPSISTLLAGLYTEMGQNKIAEAVLLDQLEKDPPDTIKSRIIEKLKALGTTIPPQFLEK